MGGGRQFPSPGPPLGFTPPTLPPPAHSIIVTAYLLQIEARFQPSLDPFGPQSRRRFGEIVQLLESFTAYVQWLG
jgi:hypothetical protein